MAVSVVIWPIIEYLDKYCILTSFFTGLSHNKISSEHVRERVFAQSYLVENALFVAL